MAYSEYDFDVVMQDFSCGNYSEVLRTTLLHAMSGNPDAQCMISLLYQNGLGVAKDLAETESWLLKAAEQGSSLAWNNLGTLHAMGGDGLSRGPDWAQTCYIRAKELGFDCAQPYPPEA